MYWTYFETIGHSPVTTGERGRSLLCKHFLPLEKSVGHSWKLLDIVWKIWAPLRKLFATPGVPSWLRAWAKPFDGLAFLTIKSWCDIDPEPEIDELLKQNADWILSFTCVRRHFVKSKFGCWHPLICSYESTWKLFG